MYRFIVFSHRHYHQLGGRSAELLLANTPRPLRPLVCCNVRGFAGTTTVATPAEKLQTGDLLALDGELFRVTYRALCRAGRQQASVIVEYAPFGKGGVTKRINVAKGTLMQKAEANKRQVSFMYTDSKRGTVVCLDTEDFSEVEVPTRLFTSAELVLLKPGFEFGVTVFDNVPRKVLLKQRNLEE